MTGQKNLRSSALAEPFPNRARIKKRWRWATGNGLAETQTGTNDSTTVLRICQPKRPRFRRLCELFLSLGVAQTLPERYENGYLTTKSNRPKIDILRPKLFVLVPVAVKFVLAQRQNIFSIFVRL
jgi:hypothetical protein